VILPSSVASIIHLRWYVCDVIVDNIPYWVVIISYRSAKNVSLSCLLQCALSRLKPRVESCSKPIVLPSYRLRISSIVVRELRNREDVMGDWRQLHKEQLHDLYFSSHTILEIKQKRARTIIHVSRMEEKRNA
jgi:hypothetical protein